MLDVRAVLDNLDDVRERTKARGAAFDIERLAALAEERRDAIHAFEQLRAEQKRASGEMKGLRPGSEEFDALRTRLREMSDRIKALDEARRLADEALEALLLEVPNPIAPGVPRGASDADNVEVRRWGTPRSFDGEEVRDHVDLATELGILDMEAAARVSGARFAFLTGAGARLERALASLMLDIQTVEHGHVEVAVPYLVHAPSLVGTGQLPKFGEDLFRAGEHYLIPTAEVPLTNLFREQIIEGLEEPIRLCAHTPCFRREAGSHGRDTRGLIRMHQFSKVEMVRICRPEDSEAEHESMVHHACLVLERLELPYRVVELCSGDIGFSAARCFDIEVWLPSRGGYVEISSCSNCHDFQARRAGIRYRPEPGARPQFAHTLNGSGLAVGRALVAVLENGQQEDGSVRLPVALVPYMGGIEVLRKGG
ncbi:MAG: serine--tRNA ligase [Deltaproteobacteria bacterium]|nr:MAG: serine--tRNA ligase [Deltaproteobacteria bacterium]